MHRLMRWMAIFLLCTGAPRTTQAADAGLYEALGGKPGVARLMSDSLDLYMQDPRLTAYMSNINPIWLKPRLSAYICMILDGGCSYRGRGMAAAHRGLHIDQAAFNAFVEDFQIAMQRNGIGFHTQNRLLARLAPMEHDIVTR